MIPIRLNLSGFLSYRDKAEIDFTGIDLACISGPNGAGKSSLLDAITWALFGQARKRDDSLIHNLCKTAEVSFIFSYEGNVYRVRRIKQREKTMLLEFQILQDHNHSEDNKVGNLNEQQSYHVSGIWKPLTEHSLRATEALIVQTLRMDYETFSNASFFLQGKADLFTQQRPSDRKRILGSILGLDTWDVYRQRANEYRRQTDAEINELDGRLQEITAELKEEETRRDHLKKLGEELKRLVELHNSQGKIVEIARQASARLQERQNLVDTLARSLDGFIRRKEEIENRLIERSAEQQQYTALIGRAAEIETAYLSWQAARHKLNEIEKVAGRFRESEKRREAPRLEIQTEKARLEQERLGLIKAKEDVEHSRIEAEGIRQDLENVQREIETAEKNLTLRSELEDNRQEKQQLQADLNAQNSTLKQEMFELNERIKTLEASEKAECPLCGQQLLAEERKDLISRLKTEGHEKGNRYRENMSKVQNIEEELGAIEEQFVSLSSAESELRKQSARAAQLKQQLLTIETQLEEWEAKGLQRLEELEKTLIEENFALAARALLKEIDAELLEIGYDAAAHDVLRAEEEVGRKSETDQGALEKARAALAPLEREISDLKKECAGLDDDQKRIKTDYEQALKAYTEIQAQTPDLLEEERKLSNIEEEENLLRMEEGAAHQKVEVLKSQKKKHKELEARREELAYQSQLYRQLEKAFSRDGVPSLLIEQALPAIESKANETLDRLSGGSMSIEFRTQAKYKDKTREDWKETLDIVISDGAGTRDYEMFSGGEAFRVNFAIRLALSKVLAQRAGARLQTLVIDEGFGSQDALGRQRLIEAINMVRSDFAKILVITHIDELKDAFPTRIEVEKNGSGSFIKIE